jgi:hypothetical protein
MGFLDTIWPEYVRPGYVIITPSGERRHVKSVFRPNNRDGTINILSYINGHECPQDETYDLTKMLLVEKGAIHA